MVNHFVAPPQTTFELAALASVHSADAARKWVEQNLVTLAQIALANPTSGHQATGLIQNLLVKEGFGSAADALLDDDQRAKLFRVVIYDRANKIETAGEGLTRKDWCNVDLITLCPAEAKAMLRSIGKLLEHSNAGGTFPNAIDRLTRAQVEFLKCLRHRRFDISDDLRSEFASIATEVLEVAAQDWDESPPAAQFRTAVVQNLVPFIAQMFKPHTDSEAEYFRAFQRMADLGPLADRDGCRSTFMHELKNLDRQAFVFWLVEKFDGDPAAFEPWVNELTVQDLCDVQDAVDEDALISRAIERMSDRVDVDPYVACVMTLASDEVSSGELIKFMNYPGAKPATGQRLIALDCFKDRSGHPTAEMLQDLLRDDEVQAELVEQCAFFTHTGLEIADGTGAYGATKAFLEMVVDSNSREDVVTTAIRYLSEGIRADDPEITEEALKKVELRFPSRGADLSAAIDAARSALADYCPHP